MFQKMMAPTFPMKQVNSIINLACVLNPTLKKSFQLCFYHLSIIAKGNSFISPKDL